MAHDVNDDSFQKQVIDSDRPVLVDFWAEWCGPCKMLSPTIEALSKELDQKIKIVKMNIEENPVTPSSLGVRSIPTLIIFKDGKPVATKSGALPKNIIEDWINSVI